MIDSNGVLQVFSRDPVPGKTKTRLIPLLGEQGAADLHRKLLIKIISVANESIFKNIELWGTSDPTESLLRDYARSDWKLYKQVGNSLGERMHHAARQALSQYEFVVIIGSDCPLLSSQILDKAYRTLEQGGDAVLGPTDDGGYYLLGMRNIDYPIFMNIPWGKSNVADITRDNMHKLGWKWIELDCLWDIDTPEDIKKLSRAGIFDVVMCETT